MNLKLREGNTDEEAAIKLVWGLTIEESSSRALEAWVVVALDKHFVPYADIAC